MFISDATSPLSMRRKVNVVTSYFMFGFGYLFQTTMFCFAKQKKVEPKKQSEFVKDVIRRSGVFFNQLATHLPDEVVYFDHEKKLPFQKTFQGVLMFLDISGESM